MRASKYIFPIVLISFLFIACEKKEDKVLTPEEIEYAKQIEHFRTQTDRYMKNNPDSPFNAKGKVEFSPLNYFDPDMDFIFQSKLTEYDPKDTVIVQGTKGEERKMILFGYLTLDYENEKHQLNVYQGFNPDGSRFHSIWFTDETTNDETYGVGRYLNFRLVNDPEHVYTIDFNAAYNPYCAYNKEYSCAIPRKEDHLDFAVEAGEKKFHD